MKKIKWISLDPFIEVFFIFKKSRLLSKLLIKSTHQSCLCPHCVVPSSRPHSRYTRIIQDLPISEKSVSLLLLTRKCFCDQATCDRQIFQNIMIGYQ